MTRNSLIVTADDILAAVKEAEAEEKRRLKKAQEEDIAAGKKPRAVLNPERAIRSGKDIVLDYIKDPARRAEPRVHTTVTNRDLKNGAGTGNGYNILVTIPMVRNRELADKIARDIERFTDHVLDEYDIPKRKRH